MEPFVSTTEFLVRRTECGHNEAVRNDVYATWIDEARAAYLRTILEPQEACFTLPTLALMVAYHTPAHLGDKIMARCWSGQIDSEMITFKYEIADAQRNVVFVTAVTQHISTTLPEPLIHAVAVHAS